MCAGGASLPSIPSTMFFFALGLGRVDLLINTPKVDRALAERGISQPFGLGVVGPGGNNIHEESEGGNESAAVAKLHEMKEEMDVSIQTRASVVYSSSLQGG